MTKRAEETLRDYWNFYVQNSHVENQPEVLKIIETANQALREERERVIDECAEVAGKQYDSVNEDVQMLSYEGRPDKFKEGVRIGALHLQRAIRALKEEE